MSTKTFLVTGWSTLAIKYINKYQVFGGKRPDQKLVCPDSSSDLQ